MEDWGWAIWNGNYGNMVEISELGVCNYAISRKLPTSQLMELESAQKKERNRHPKSKVAAVISTWASLLLFVQESCQRMNQQTSMHPYRTPLWQIFPANACICIFSGKKRPLLTIVCSIPTGLCLGGRGENEYFYVFWPIFLLWIYSWIRIRIFRMMYI